MQKTDHYRLWQSLLIFNLRKIGVCVCVCEKDREMRRKEGPELKRRVKHAVIYTWKILVSKPTFMHQRATAIDGRGD